MPDGDKPDHTNILIALAIIVVLILIAIWFRNSMFDDFLYGMWSADTDFCDESDLNNFNNSLSEMEDISFSRHLK